MAAALTWENFRRYMLEPGIPAHRAVAPDAKASIFVSERGLRIGLRARLASSAPTALPTSPLKQIRFEVVGQHLEVTTATSPLFREFFHFCLSMADLVKNGVDPLEALDTTLRSWTQLLTNSARLSEEEELGLIGELWALSRLRLGVGPAAAVESWVGPRKEPHDFRWKTTELEVKVTQRPARIHRITSLQQLEASAGCQLFLLSLQFEPAGGGDGVTLPGMVAELRQMLGASAIGAFNELLAQGTRYDDADAHLYTERYRLRTKPALILIERTIPRITSDLLRPFGESAARLTSVEYSINVEGLGNLEGEPPFEKILPRTRRRRA